jgi:hypothetical protein
MFSLLFVPKKNKTPSGGYGGNYTSLLVYDYSEFKKDEPESF